MILIGTVMPVVPTLASLLAKILMLAMPTPKNIWDAIT